MSGSATVFHPLNETVSVPRTTNNNGHHDTHRLPKSTTPFSGPSSSITSSTHPSPAPSSATSSRQESQQPTVTGAPHSRQHRLSFASLARDKTSSAFANLASRSNPAIPTLHTSSSIRSLSEKRSTASIAARDSGTIASLGCQELPLSGSQDSLAKTDPSRLSDSTQRRGGGLAPSRADQHPPHHQLQSSSRNAAFLPGHTPQGSFNKMHQTSSRLLRMTDEERPFTRVSILCQNHYNGSRTS